MKLKQFLVSAIIVCGCGLLANMNSSTLAMMNDPQIHMNNESAIDGNNQTEEPDKTFSVISGKLEERDPTRPLCNCEECQKWGDRSKVFHKIVLHETNVKNSMKKLKKIKVTAYPVANNNIGRLELHDAYIENTEDNCLILCIPYDLPEGKYNFIIQYNYENNENDGETCDHYNNVPLIKPKK